MNRLEVQEIYDKVNTTRSIFAVDVLGLKACLYYDLFGSLSVERMSDTDVYFMVKQKLKELCDYALNAKDKKGSYERILVTKNSSDKMPLWLYIGDSDVTVRHPNAQVVDPRSSLEDAASALKALQDTLQKDVFSKLETVLESLREAQKD